MATQDFNVDAEADAVVKEALGDTHALFEACADMIDINWSEEENATYRATLASMSNDIPALALVLG